jgi:hypothetical protein
LEHLRVRRQIVLFSEGALRPRQSARVLRHVEQCRSCADALDAVLQATRLIREEALSVPEPPLGTAALVARIAERIEQSRTPRRDLLSLLRRPAFGATLAAASALLIVGIWSRQGMDPEPPAAEASVVSSDSLDRLERTIQREGLVRYLSEATDVLVATSSVAADCERTTSTVDLASTPDTSRDLLARRARLVSDGTPPFARPVLDDVELALRDVAVLPSCARRADVARVRQEIERRQILLRVRLAVRELEG